MNTDRIKTGIKGLDEILFGGFLPHKAYLLRGGPGTGKSTIGYKFLEEGAEIKGANSLLITLSEPKENAIENAASVNIDLSKISILDLSPEEQIYTDGQTYDVFPAAKVESTPLIKAIVEKIEEVKPDRVLLDSVSMLKYMHQDPYQYRNIVLSFIRYICNKGATVIMVSETVSEKNDKQVSFWVDGIINVEYSPSWRRIEVTKFRGSDFHSGLHSFKVSDNGPEVFPKLRPKNYSRQFQSQKISFGIEEMDKLLNGGIEKGTINLISGPTGVGKTSLGTQFIKEAAMRNERSVIYTFEESEDVILQRTNGIGIDLKQAIDSGKLRIVSIEPFSYSPDEFSSMVRNDIKKNEISVVMIDSIGGFRLSFTEKNHLQRLHSLGVYLQNMGVTTFFINEVQSITGPVRSTELNANYLADNIIFLRYIEHGAEVRKIIGVLKKRFGDFDRTIREFQIKSTGLMVGDPMDKFRGLLSGNPTEIQ